MFTEFNWIEATGSSPIFMVLVGLSIVTLAVALERAWYFWKRWGNPDETLSQTVKKIRAGQIEEAAWTCESSNHPMGKVASEVFRTGRRKGESYEEKLQVALSQQKLLLERNLSILGTMAAIAPLVGLLRSTIWPRPGRRRRPSSRRVSRRRWLRPRPVWWSPSPRSSCTTTLPAV
jgi:biopolymer transport protein ExbB/TolQ